MELQLQVTEEELLEFPEVRSDQFNTSHSDKPAGKVVLCTESRTTKNRTKENSTIENRSIENSAIENRTEESSTEKNSAEKRSSHQNSSKSRGRCNANTHSNTKVEKPYCK